MVNKEIYYFPDVFKKISTPQYQGLNVNGIFLWNNNTQKWENPNGEKYSDRYVPYFIAKNSNEILTIIKFSSETLPINTGYFVVAIFDNNYCGLVYCDVCIKIGFYQYPWVKYSENWGKAEYLKKQYNEIKEN